MRLARLGVAVAVVAAVGGSVSACQSHSCDATTTVVDAKAAEIVSTRGLLTYATSRTTGPWLDLPGNGTIEIDFPPELGVPYDWSVKVSTSQYQGPDAGFTLTTAAGQLDETTSLSGSTFSVTNTTCAEYFAQIILYWLPTASSADGGTADAKAD